MRTVIKNNVKSVLRKILAENSGSEQIAMGSALGMFVGLLPIMGIQTIVVLPLAIFFRVNKIASVLFIWVTNVFTFIFIYSFNYWVGIIFLKHFFPASSFLKMHQFQKFLLDINLQTALRYGTRLFLPLLTGSFLVAFVGAVLTYFSVVIVFRIFRHEIGRFREQ
ncbi:MAG: hypothetical protein A2096_13335 [Spirochaetes bacterium GWF1_41_5]|nr:MAG: hypothetical protein A2096_13335 [Spirochaetes bacterium GWF1_41_5]HBE01227.1 hypothetical protein [Spirochaetia bacterium]